MNLGSKYYLQLPFTISARLKTLQINPCNFIRLTRNLGRIYLNIQIFYDIVQTIVAISDFLNAPKLKIKKRFVNKKKTKFDGIPLKVN